MNIQDEESDLTKKRKVRLIKFSVRARGGVQSWCRRVTGPCTDKSFYGTFVPISLCYSEQGFVHALLHTSRSMQRVRRKACAVPDEGRSRDEDPCKG